MEPNREDILIGRVTDGEASPTDWQELEALAASDATVWSRLALAQRRHAELERAVDDALTVAELVDAPDLHAESASSLTQRWRSYAGWAAAAAIALAWAGASSFNFVPGGPATQTGAMVPMSMGTDELINRYLDTGKKEGRVIAELPMVMVESRPLEGEKGSEVVYLRQVLERVKVEDIYRLGADELGRPTPTPFVPEARPRNDNNGPV